MGETLAADVTGIADEDGLDNVTFSYQWMADDVNIQDATGSNYTLVSDDEGKTIKVTVSFTDDEDNPETLTSDPTGKVAAKPNSQATGAPTITGTAQVGQTLTREHGGHRRRGRAGGRHLHLPVAGRRRGNRRSKRLRIHPYPGRAGQDHQGQGVLHRRRR